MSSRRSGIKQEEADPRQEIIEKNHQEEIEKAFHTFDTNNSNTLDKHEFRYAFRSLGFEMTKTKTDKYFEHYECLKDGMPFKIFQKIALKQYGEQTRRDVVEKAFGQFDFDKNAKIGVKDILAAYHLVGEDKTEKQVEYLIKEFDEDGDGELTYDEFCEIFFPTK
ncbi:EF hand family protein [Trichomonas vaginalis G3]|uniref:EF hand family protein n=1 Tax=Trichomonas vaginalis (strain ATCC PRA-98 / G3) TaxID=412133 RepID=A2E210_TRIV3|nr:calcium ion binding [Trichomonas vaginalis G3]EAY13359.1 EF hand family protein [Trichomonas vaginalis G3]KAI5540371.1 calcium ion binding [Trichomonas vaginalis G3]|eukprot:XP_001325582.1 EF hand family protein [Trichomonas vaginalis G3]